MTQKIDIPMQLFSGGHDLVHTFPNLCDALEVLAVLDGIKPVSREIVDEDEMWKIHGFCLAHGLSYATSPFKVVKGTTMLVEPQHPMGGRFFVYLSRDKKKADEAAFFESIRNDEKLGESLGYPPCCTAFYKKHQTEAETLGDDYCQFTLDNSRDGAHPYLTNNLLRFFGITLLAHFPCSFECKQSISLAERTMDSVHRSNPALASFLRDALKGPVIYHHGTGVHALKDYLKKGNAKSRYIIHYGTPWMTHQNQMHDTLALCDNIHVLDRHHVQLRQGSHVVDELEGSHVGIVMFE